MNTRTETSAGGVAFRLREDGGSDVALIRTHEGRWQLPKGWIEPGETMEDTARRETREEAGIVAEVIGPLDTIEYWYNSTYDAEPTRVHKFVHFFLLRYLRGSTDDHDHEVDEARWVDIEDAEHMLAFKDERRMVSLARHALDKVTADMNLGARHDG